MRPGLGARLKMLHWKEAHLNTLMTNLLHYWGISIWLKGPVWVREKDERREEEEEGEMVAAHRSRFCCKPVSAQTVTGPVTYLHNTNTIYAAVCNEAWYPTGKVASKSRSQKWGVELPPVLPPKKKKNLIGGCWEMGFKLLVGDWVRRCYVNNLPKLNVHKKQSCQINGIAALWSFLVNE